MKFRYFQAFLAFCMLSFNSLAQTATDTIQIPATALQEEIQLLELESFSLSTEQGNLTLRSGEANGKTLLTINGEPVELTLKNGSAQMPFLTDAKGKLLLLQTGKKNKLYHVSAKSDGNFRLRHIPFWFSILPPLIAILLALLFKEVVSSLFVGIFAGAFIAGGLRIDSIYYFLISIFEVVEKYIVAALTDAGHMSVIIFSLLIGGMVAVISRNGGMAGVVNVLSKYAKTRKSAQLVTWLLGVAIFFDDYANTLIVGNTMRSVTDKFKISREKLAYIVDSTAAPVASVAFITTWIGAELTYIDDGMTKISALAELGLTPYSIFFMSLKYSFYPVLTLIFIVMLVRMGRDYGPMFKAEKRAYETGKVSPPQTATGLTEELEDLSPVKGAPLIWYNAAIPVLVVIFMTMFGLIDTGMASLSNDLGELGILAHSWGEVWRNMSVLFDGGQGGFFLKLGKLIGSADSYIALIWASISGLALAIFLTIGRKIMRLSDTINTMTTGFKTMLPAIIILTLAWSLAGTTDDLHTAEFITSALADSINPYILPAIIFVLAALISFSTGSSWSTMAILYPIAIPTAWAVCQSSGMDTLASLEILLNVISIVLAASVLGDHCSPISDTTILSSLASDCKHIEHVRTQLPYALTVGIVSIFAATVSAIVGGSWLKCTIILIAGLVVLFFVIRTFGKQVEGHENRPSSGQETS
jgi:Na+/H+ antiporter NhaC